MNKALFFKYISSIVLLLYTFTGSAQLVTADAGPDIVLCPGNNSIIGGSPTAAGGLPPYSYSWNPSTGLSSDSSPNPVASPTDNISYTLTVTDDTGAVQTDIVNITMAYISLVNAGEEIDFCRDESGTIGSTYNVTGQGVSYAWSPATGLNDSTLPRPTADPTETTVYTLTATMAGCPSKIDSVTVTVIQPPPIFAGNDTTIKEGERLTLHASGGFNYEWFGTNLMYNTTADPDAEPVYDAIYIVYGTDAEKRCHAYDTIILFVTPSDDVVFYNTFTPNADGNNDTWYIGNIAKYPNNRLEIYNRNGKLVFKQHGYDNLWDGKSYLGESLPASTYYYIMDLGNNAGIHRGTVSIVK